MVSTVSAVMSTYNRSDYLRWALGSVLAQRDVDLEVVVVNNGSTDDTQARLDDLNDPRVRVVRNVTSLGGIGGRNSGLSVAQGDWVAIVDDDDMWAPDKLATQVAAAEKVRRDWVYAGAVHIDEGNAVVHGRPPVTPAFAVHQLPIEWCLPGGISNVAWRRGTLDEDGLLHPRLSFTADWDVALRLLRCGPPAAVRRPLVAYRQHADNASHQADKQQDQMEMMGPRFADLRDGRSLPIGPRHRFIASQALIRNDRWAAVKAYSRALRHGDVHALVRAPAVLMPRALHPTLRRLFMSDKAWIREGEQWIADVKPAW